MFHFSRLSTFPDRAWVIKYLGGSVRSNRFRPRETETEDIQDIGRTSKNFAEHIGKQIVRTTPNRPTNTSTASLSHTLAALTWIRSSPLSLVDLLDPGGGGGWGDASSRDPRARVEHAPPPLLRVRHLRACSTWRSSPSRCALASSRVGASAAVGASSSWRAPRGPRAGDACVHAVLPVNGVRDAQRAVRLVDHPAEGPGARSPGRWGPRPCLRKSTPGGSSRSPRRKSSGRSRRAISARS